MIVLIVKKRFLQAEEVFRSSTLSSRHLLALTVTMIPTERLMGLTMGSRESNWKWLIGHLTVNGEN